MRCGRVECFDVTGVMYEGSSAPRQPLQSGIAVGWMLRKLQKSAREIDRQSQTTRVGIQGADGEVESWLDLVGFLVGEGKKQQTGTETEETLL